MAAAIPNDQATIENNYVTPPHPTALSGISKLSEYYQLPKERIANILSNVDSYTLHREYHKPRVRNPFYIYHLRQQVQVDLIDMQQLSRFNNNYNYLIICIDCFSRFVWVRAVKTKHHNEIIPQMIDIIASMGQKPESIFCDKGAELKNQYMIQLLRKENIKLMHPNSELKAAIVERANRSIQNLIYKYMTENQTRNYIDTLQLIVEAYNNRPHRSIDKLSPREAELPENAERTVGALRQHYTDCLRPKFRTKHKIGDTVRYKIDYGNRFARGYNEQFSNELVTIDDINRRMAIPMYQLRSADTGERIIGNWYQEELQSRNSQEFKIEKVLDRRVRRGVPEVFVKWLHFGDRHNCWIPENNVTRTFQVNQDN
jgi:hypothetical protein